MTFLERFHNQDERALARAISLVEAGGADGQSLLQTLRNTTSRARILGITGSPGSGKSTLTDQLIKVARSHQRRVAVLAIDPTSPFTGGAILGDRIRMMGHHGDSGVFIRSMATRGHLGGLATTTLQVLVLLEAYGFDDIFIETVGVGQSEIDIVRVADTTVLVLTPGQGDGVQAFKAGIMEIADIFVINKADLPGASRLKREVQAALELGHKTQELPDILESIASEAKGTTELYTAITKHHEGLKLSGKLDEVRKGRGRFEITLLLTEQLRLVLQRSQDALIDKILKGELTSHEALRELLETTPRR
ncbi:MAG: methylmalonyl Co-A mutase-associated GTPase MeaB [Trueperaceae bacterium]